MVKVNNADCKHLFDNRYGTGQSVWDGINRTTNLIVAGKIVVVAGYGWCGKGVAMRAKGFGARVIVTEVDPVKAIEAVMDGFDVMPMDEAARIGDIFITATGMKDVIVRRHFEVMKDCAVVCNTGHYDVELNIPDLESIAVSSREIRRNNDEYTKADGNRIYLLCRGRLVNLAGAEGHPSEVMDMSFANQFMSMLRMKNEGRSMERRVYDISEEQDQEIAKLKLETMGKSIDRLTPEQEIYATDYSAGT